MRTLALRAGARVTVVAAEWRDAFAVVTHGRVQLELRDGRPGPVLRRDAGFWLRGTGVRALHNPGRRTARVRVGTPRTGLGTPTTTGPERNDMFSRSDTEVVAGPVPGPARGLRRTAGTGLAATLVATGATTLAAALARAAGVGFEIPDGGEVTPLSGFAVVTGFFSLMGLVIAAAFRRWSGRAAERFGWTAVALTALSMVPPLLAGADTATTATLIGLHLVPAAVMIPVLVRGLRTRTD